MGNVLVKEETLTEIADSIREKNGLSEKYLPSAMPDAIRNISTSSDTGPNEADPIRFYGYEGKLLYSYSLEEMKALTELPPLPKVDGLICQGWNWSLENLQGLNREMDVGAIFITDDGATRIYVTLTEHTLHPFLGFYQKVANCMQVDWGDGSPLESTDTVDEVYWFEHQYECTGSYVVRLIPTEDAKVLVYGSVGGTELFQKNTENTRSSSAYANAIEKIEIGKGIAYLGDSALLGRKLKYVTIPNETIDFRAALEGCISLKFVAIPNTITSLWSDGLYNCTDLEKVCFPDNLVTVYGDACKECISLKTACLPETVKGSGTTWFANCDSLRKISFPDNLTSIPTSVVSACARIEEVVMSANVKSISSQAFYNCKRLKKIELPEGITKLPYAIFYGNELLDEIKIPESVTTIDSSVFQFCYGLSELKIPKNVATIAANAFYGCMGIENYYFYPTTPPTLSADTVFKNIHSSCKIHVPKGCLEAYQTADIWSGFVDYLVEMEE